MNEIPSKADKANIPNRANGKPGTPEPAKNRRQGPGPYQPKPGANAGQAKSAGNGRPSVAFDAQDPLLKQVRDGIAYNQERGDYWRRTEEGHFVKASERDLKRHLRRLGFDLRTAVAGDFEFTKFDNAICYAQEHAAVDHVFDLAGHKAGVFRTEDGRRVLVPRGARLITPMVGSFGNWQALLNELFGQEQLKYVLAWLRIAVEDLYSLAPSQWRHSQLLTLVGPRGCGKSFFQDLVTAILGGRVADPYDMLCGDSLFTKDAAEAAHWKMDDKPPMRNLSRRMEFAANVKHHCVSSITDVHAKGRDKVVLPTFRRLTLSTNAESDYLTVIPPYDDSMADKLLVFLCGKATMLPDYHENRVRFIRELPALLHYLLKVHTIPENLRHERTGVAAYFNPEVRDMVEDFEPQIRLRELIDLVLFASELDGPWKGTAAVLQTELTGDARYGSLARQILPHSSEVGRLLALLKQEEPLRFKDMMSRGIRHWTITSPLR